jgi:hypothetical protein
VKLKEEQHKKGGCDERCEDTVATRNWFRAKTLCLVTGLIGLAQAGYCFQNQDSYGQEKTSPPKTTFVFAGLARPQMEEFLLKFSSGSGFWSRFSPY